MIDINIVPPAAAASPGFWSPQVIAAFITGFIALITASVVSAITFRQWKTANDKLLMDLFDRRFENFRTIMGAIASRHDDVMRNQRLGVLMGKLPKEPMESFYRAVAVSHFLFGPEVKAALEGVERALVVLDGLKGDPPNTEEDPAGDAREALDAAVLDYIEAVEPYMMVGHIAAKGRAKP
ncbi:hypothetical protein [Brevundimonas lenta]|uniref:Uncharacterized protein n=1 Tax=Brevundimonas lenta TaxID=424796 RepID=A0A7W6NQP1_9CAUL|nr:hypothetical protein [Brevundimonas lenta]MBB4083402.1 hypothetical protein [Brevundimonas lenta]